MVEVVGVRFHPAGHIYYYAPGTNEYQRTDHVLVESQQCLQLAEVALGNRELPKNKVPDKLSTIKRKANEADFATAERNQADAQKAFQIAKKKIESHHLEMKLVKAEYTFDRNRVIFYFTADGRIDFRELVKDLAGVFRTRIELRQIGVRDEAKLLGGLGPCGRPICCASFLDDFTPVSIKMAKDQGLSLNPTKISGICGRLLCCLQYENNLYEEAKHLMPRYGKEVTTPDGSGKVIGLNLLNQEVKVRLYSRETPATYPAESVQQKKRHPDPKHSKYKEEKKD